MGKGSTQRPTDKKQFDDNYDRIFGRKDKSDDQPTPQRKETPDGRQEPTR